MPGDQPVQQAITADLCAAFRGAQAARLDSIASTLTAMGSDIHEMREDIHQTHQVLNIGNGGEPLTNQIAKNTDFRIQVQAAQQEIGRRRLTLGIASAGWALTLAGLAIALFAR